MSCQHGNWGGQCEICDEIDAAWKAGEASGKRSAEHCTCPACRITHASDCAVHNMPAMPNGPCDCGAVQSAHPARSGVVSEEDVNACVDVYEAVYNGNDLDVREKMRAPDTECMRAALKHFERNRK